MLCRCANCEWEGDSEETNEIQDFWSRVEPDDLVPAGECPECGALCFVVHSRWVSAGRF